MGPNSGELTQPSVRAREATFHTTHVRWATSPALLPAPAHLSQADTTIAYRGMELFAVRPDTEGPG